MNTTDLKNITDTETQCGPECAMFIPHKEGYVTNYCTMRGKAMDKNHLSNTCMFYQPK